jgi:hypothetical protein
MHADVSESCWTSTAYNHNQKMAACSHNRGTSVSSRQQPQQANDISVTGRLQPQPKNSARFSGDRQPQSTTNGTSDGGRVQIRSTNSTISVVAVASTGV